MKKFNVQLFYTSCLELPISAETEEDALLQAEEIANSLTNDEFVNLSEPQSNGYDIIELEN